MNTPTPKPLRKGEKENFYKMRRAAFNNDLALISAIRKCDNKQVALIVAMQRNDNGTFTPVPLAQMIEGDPYELYYDPFSELGA